MTTLNHPHFQKRQQPSSAYSARVPLDTSEVEISRSANCDLIIHPIPLTRGATLMAALNGFDNEFASQLEQDYQQQSQ
jgi:antitoxin VapB